MEPTTACPTAEPAPRAIPEANIPPIPDIIPPPAAGCCGAAAGLGAGLAYGLAAGLGGEAVCLLGPLPNIPPPPPPDPLDPDDDLPPPLGIFILFYLLY